MEADADLPELARVELAQAQTGAALRVVQDRPEFTENVQDGKLFGRRCAAAALDEFPAQDDIHRFFFISARR